MALSAWLVVALAAELRQRSPGKPGVELASHMNPLRVEHLLEHAVLVVALNHLHLCIETGSPKAEYKSFWIDSSRRVGTARYRSRYHNGQMNTGPDLL